MRIDRTRRLIVCGALLGLSLPTFGEPLLDDLVQAVANDRVDVVEKLLARGMDPDSVDANGDTLLCIAARSRNARTVQALLAAKAHPD